MKDSLFIANNGNLQTEFNRKSRNSACFWRFLAKFQSLLASSDLQFAIQYKPFTNFK